MILATSSWVDACELTKRCGYAAIAENDGENAIDNRDGPSLGDADRERTRNGAPAVADVPPCASNVKG